MVQYMAKVMVLQWLRIVKKLQHRQSKGLESLSVQVRWDLKDLYFKSQAGIDRMDRTIKKIKTPVKIVNNELPIVQAKCEGLRREVELLESKRESLEKEIFDLHATLVQYRTSYREESALIDTRHQEILELKESAREFENNNEEYINNKEGGNNVVESISK
jgi:chromosome segregation ATPase